jgi:hypothetical protein
MLTGDVPDLYKACNFRSGPILGELPELPFTSAHRREVGPDRWIVDVVGPKHLLRTTRAPVLRWSAPDVRVDRWEIVVSPGGDLPEAVFPLPREASEFRCPEELWHGMRTNTAYWWAVFGVVDADPSLTVRSRTVRCVIHHRAIPRVTGSTLQYSGPPPEPDDSGPEAAPGPAPSRSVLGSLKGLVKKALAPRAAD